MVLFLYAGSLMWLCISCQKSDNFTCVQHSIFYLSGNFRIEAISEVFVIGKELVLDDVTIEDLTFSRISNCRQTNTQKV